MAAIGLVLALAITAVPATAQDALICRKRDKQGDKSGDTHKLGGGKDYFNTIFGSEASDGLLFGDIGDDVIRGGGGDDSIDGGGSNDMLFGGNGNDSILGGDGVDALSGEADTDDCDGGEGNNDQADSTCEKVSNVP